MNTIATSRIRKISPQLLVADIEHSLEFYINTLGFALDFRHEDFYAGIVRDGCSIHLKSGEPCMEERKNKRDNADLDLVFSVDGIEHLYDELSNKPAQIMQPLREMTYGKEFYIADPDGYIIGFIEEI